MTLLSTPFATVPLRRSVEINARTLLESTDPDYEFRYVDIASVGRGFMAEEPRRMTFAQAPSRARRVLQGGDILVSTVRTYLRSVMRIPDESRTLIGSTGFAVLSASRRSTSRFLGWYTQSDAFVEDVVSRSVGVSYPAISPTDLGDIPVPTPAEDEELAIANFLDAETARIDALIAKKRSMVGMVGERDRALVDACFASDEHGATTRLGRMATIGTGLTLDGGREVDDNAVTRPYLRVANVQPGWLDLSEVKDVTVPRYIADRCELRSGDVLMTEGGDIDKLGRGTVWRGEIKGCLHQNHVFAVHPRPDFLDADYLAHLTRTSHARRYFESTGSQSTNLASTNSSKVADLPVPVLPVDTQRGIVRQYESAAHTMATLRNRLERQIELLQERRRALVTAAVTGQLEVPGVGAA